jgi:hypothetical protein
MKWNEIREFIKMLPKNKKPAPELRKTERQNWVDVFGADQLTIDEAKISLLNMCHKYDCLAGIVLIEEACRQLSGDIMERFTHDEVDQTSRNREDWDA